MEWFTLIVGVILGFLVGRIVEFNVWYDETMKRGNVPCIHGHENWDDCPVCGH